MSIIRKIKEFLVHYTWNLAYFDYDESVITNGLDFRRIHIVKNPYKKKWFADPFILSDSDRELTLLVEEYDSDIRRGRIAQIIIDKSKDCIVSCDIILDLPTHLSFPVIYRIGEKIMVHPENSASGSSYVYEYNHTEKKLINPIMLIDEPLTDAIIIKENHLFKMFATRLPDPNGCNLRTYVSKDLLGPYEEVGVDNYPHCRARMAGQFLTYGCKVIRPAQDCEGAYGKAVIFFDGHNELGEIRPKSYRYAGVHTFNRYNNMCIIDIKRFDYPLLVCLKDKIKRVL